MPDRATSGVGADGGGGRESNPPAKLAAARIAGAHPYLVTPEHTRQARNILGPGKLLAPEQRVVMEADPAKARAVGRPSVVKPYLGLTNYTSNVQRLGFTEQDVAGEGSDRLIDALVISGDGATIARRFEEHHQAGAGYVAVQFVAGPGADLDVGCPPHRRSQDAKTVLVTCFRWRRVPRAEPGCPGQRAVPE
jgi:hypothetical protein